MSLELARTWVHSMFRAPRAGDDAVEFLEYANAEHNEATLIVGPGLTTNGKCYLARWTRRELLVTELLPGQQRSLAISSDALFRRLEGRDLMPELPPKPCITLAEFQIRARPSHEVAKSIVGECRCSFDDSASSGFLFCGLRAEYFRTDLPRQIFAFTYYEEPIVPPGGDLGFHFESLSNLIHSDEVRGTLVLFFQLFRADDWSTKKGIKRISNVASAVIETQ